MKIWIVQGEAGEYEDHREWIVAAFLSEKKAQELREKAQKRADKIRSMPYEVVNVKRPKNGYDPTMSCFERTAYYVYSLKVRDA